MLSHRLAAPFAGAIAAAVVALAVLLLDPRAPLWAVLLTLLVTGGAVLNMVLLIRIGRAVVQARADVRHLTRGSKDVTESMSALQAVIRAQGRVLDEANDRARRAAQALRLGTGGVTQRVRQDVIRDVDALLTLHGTYGASRALVPLTSYSALPSTSLLLADVIRSLPDGATAVELGGGASTVWMGLASAARGRTVQIISVDHDAAFLELTREAVARHELVDIVDVRHAPLVPHSDGAVPYYDINVLADTAAIDLLFIDGPPGATGPLARMPAVGAFASRIRPGGFVVIDDADRSDEREVVDAWTSWSEGVVRFVVAENRERAVILAAVANDRATRP